MTETHATPPVFPPGRYGRRRAVRRRRWVTVVVATVFLLISLLVAGTMYLRYGDPAYQAQVIRYTGVTDTQVVVDFQVTVPPGGSARCALRARSYDGAEVGRVEVLVTAAPGQRRAVARHTVPTSARPFIGEVVRCRAAA